MSMICLYLHIHQPFRYRQYSMFEIGRRNNYWQDEFYSKQSNERIFRKVTEKSYRPMLALLERNLTKHQEFKVSLSMTGTWLEQAEEWAPELILQLKRLVDSGRVEILAETYYHSLAFFYDFKEFEAQVQLHQQRVWELFGVKAQVFRNTELAYNDELGLWADGAGFLGVLAEGWDKILKGRSPNQVYRVAGAKKAKLLLKNYRLSDDIAFRFSDKNWRDFPLTMPKYREWLKESAKTDELINLFMDFETFGEHQWRETGIFEFMDDLIEGWIDDDGEFVTTTEACQAMEPKEEVKMPETVTWADMERDLSAWNGNAMQQEAIKILYDMKNEVMKSGDARIMEDFRRLTTSDHAYYMCTKYWNDGDVHAYFSAYDSPYEAFMYYMNVVRDLKYRLSKKMKLGR